MTTAGEGDSHLPVDTTGDEPSSPSGSRTIPSRIDEESDTNWWEGLGEIAGGVVGVLFFIGVSGATVEWALERFFGIHDGEAYMDENNWLYLVALALPIVALGLLVALVILLSAISEVPRYHWFEVLAWIIALGVVALLLWAPFAQRDQIDERIRSGQPVTIGLSPLPLIEFKEVSLVLDEPARSPGCVILLGVAKGYVVYVDPEADFVIRAPTESAMLSESCP